MFSWLRHAFNVKIFAVTCIAFLLYLYIWNRFPKLAWLLLGLGVAWLVYETLDWPFWDDYFKLHWKLT